MNPLNRKMGKTSWEVWKKRLSVRYAAASCTAVCDKEQYRVTSAVQTPHRCEKCHENTMMPSLPAASSHLIALGAVFMESGGAYRVKLILTGLQTFKRTQIRTDDGEAKKKQWGKKRKGKKRRKRKWLLALIWSGLHIHYPPILGQVALTIRPAERSTCARLIAAIRL